MMLFKRERDAAGACWYEDPREQKAAALMRLRFGVDLASIDDWIEHPQRFDNSDLERVIDWRHRAVQAVAAANWEAAEAWGLFLATLAHWNQREVFLVPLAQIGHDFKDKLPAPGERGVVYNPHKSVRRVKERNARIAEALRRGEPLAEVARSAGLSKRQVERIRARENS